jgi:DNA modification methylase
MGRPQATGATGQPRTLTQDSSSTATTRRCSPTSLPTASGARLTSCTSTPPFDSGADYVRRVSLRGPKATAKPLDGEGYTLGEQIQYTDIWANDAYLQFMYERLLLLKELLSPRGLIYVHLDWRRVSQLRLALDEIFGADAFRNEIVWQYKGKGLTGDKGKFPSFHASILAYGRGEGSFFAPEREEGIALSVVRRWGNYLREDGTITFGALRAGNEQAELDKAERRFRAEHARDPEDDDIAVEYEGGALIRDVWTDIPVVRANDRYRGWHGYPTEKPVALIERVIRTSCPPGGLVLDCFVGSGTTAEAAQKLGRRWVACDINKGAIQTSTKRLMDVIGAQAAAGQAAQGALEGDAGAPDPAQLGFATYRVNDYDLAIQHNEAVELACDALGVQRSRTDGYFDGTLGRQLVKILPFDHPATPLDIEAVVDELRNRPTEDRDITLVALGKEAACDARLAEHNRRGAPNKITLVELRSDPKYGKFFAHQTASAEVHLEGVGTQRRVVIDDVLSPTIIERLDAQESVVAPRVTDWRMVVDSVLIDPAYDGHAFEIRLADVPTRKTDFVAGTYDLPAEIGPMIAVKITDMLGEEVLVTLDPGETTAS